MKLLTGAIVISGPDALERVLENTKRFVGRGYEVKDWRVESNKLRALWDRIKQEKTPLQIMIDRDEHAGNCQAGTYHGAVLPNGDIYPCSLFIGYPQFKMGNLFGDVKKETNPEYLKLVDYKAEEGHCDSCNGLPICKASRFAIVGDFK